MFLEAATEFPTSIAVGESQEDSVVNNNKYSLRPKKPITERFQFPISMNSNFPVCYILYKCHII